MSGFLKKPRGPPNQMQLSIDSVRPKIAEYMTGVHGFLKRVTRSAQICNQYGLNPRVKCVLTSINYKEMKNIIEYFLPYGVKKFQFVLYGLSYYKPRPDLLLNREQKKWIKDFYMDRILPFYKGFQILMQEDEFGDYSPEKKKELWSMRARCTGGYSAITILPTGKAVICEQMPQTTEFIVGDYKNGGLMGLWNDPKLKKFLFPSKEQFIDSACGECEDFDACVNNAGFCFRDALFAYDTVFQAPPRCPNQKKSGRRIL